MKLGNVLWLAPLAAVLCAQEGAVSVSSPAWKGMEVQFVSKVEPSGNGVERLPGGVVPTSDRAQRVIFDRQHRRYFGYDLRLEPLADSQTVRLRMDPLSLTGQQLEGFGIKTGWTLLAPAKFPVLPVMHVGDTVALDVLVNPSTGQKVVDYVSLRSSHFESVRASNTPRDFSLADVELKLDSPRIWVNNRLVDGGAQGASTGGITAHVLWLYLAGAGSFEFSLVPEAALGFQKAGTAAANTLTFRSGTTEYRVECATPIVPGSALYNLYMLHDPGFRPSGNDAASPYLIGGADKAEFLIRKR